MHHKRLLLNVSLDSPDHADADKEETDLVLMLHFWPEDKRFRAIPNFKASPGRSHSSTICTHSLAQSQPCNSQ